MLVHKVLSSLVAGYGYENDTLRVVLKSSTGLKAYDYHGVTEEDAGNFTQGLGKSYTYIKRKYGDRCQLVTDVVYFSE
jgi:hypothetical protein